MRDVSCKVVRQTNRAFRNYVFEYQVCENSGIDRKAHLVQRIFHHKSGLYVSCTCTWFIFFEFYPDNTAAFFPWFFPVSELEILNENPQPEL
jgi:hypothetical protein